MGFDLNPNSAKCHYHNRYLGGKKKIPNRHLNRYYNNFKLAFEIVKQKTNIEIISCSKGSRLNSLIKFVPFGEL